jgi:hypothetical protein
MGAIRLKVSTGNLTGMHAREKCFRRKIENTKKPTEKKMFLLLASSKEVEPQEPTTMEDWEAALTASQAIVDEIVEETIHISSFSERALSQSLGPVDIEIARLRKKATPAPPRPVTPTTAPRPSSDAPQSPRLSHQLRTGTVRRPEVYFNRDQKNPSQSASSVVLIS